jgi:ATP-dependent RNA helicase SUPV3L1/SUV3
VPRGAGNESARAYAAIGFPIFGARAIRADVVERALRDLSGDGDVPIGSLIGCPARDIPGVITALTRVDPGAGA